MVRSLRSALILLAIPGILAGLQAASGSSVVADYIQVYYRLAHHLDPDAFCGMGMDRLTGSWRAFGFAGGLGCLAANPRNGFSGSSSAAVLIALGGFAVGWRFGPPEHVRNYLLPWKWLGYPLRWKLLKLYPFRLFDAMLPIAVAITLAGLARRWCEQACRLPNARRDARCL